MAKESMVPLANFGSELSRWIDGFLYTQQSFAKLLGRAPEEWELADKVLVEQKSKQKVEGPVDATVPGNYLHRATEAAIALEAASHSGHMENVTGL